MSDNEILYCLIAFILGWLASRMMGEGFTSAQMTTDKTACQAGLQDVAGMKKGKAGCVEYVNSYPDQPNSPLRNREGTPYCSASMIKDWCSTECGQDNNLCGGRSDGRPNWPECCDGLDCHQATRMSAVETCRKCNSTLKKKCSGNWAARWGCENNCSIDPPSDNASALRAAGCTSTDVQQWCTCSTTLEKLCPNKTGEACHTCAGDHQHDLRMAGCTQAALFDEICAAPSPPTQ